MAAFLVYRHGSNRANQSMTPVMAVAIVEAEDYEAARSAAASRINCYNNQHLELVAEEDLTEEQCEDWNSVSLRDAELRSVGEESIIF